MEAVRNSAGNASRRKAGRYQMSHCGHGRSPGQDDPAALRFVEIMSFDEVLDGRKYDWVTKRAYESASYLFGQPRSRGSRAVYLVW